MYLWFPEVLVTVFMFYYRQITKIAKSFVKSVYFFINKIIKMVATSAYPQMSYALDNVSYSM